MSLSGNLGFVPIDEVLRLLTRSHQQGSVEVTGRALRGRVFVGKGGIDLATTYEDSDLHRYIVNSRYADERTLHRVTSGETTLAAAAENNTALIELLREMTVESLFQIADRGEDFQVHERVTTPYASPKSFELESLLRDADERQRQWNAVSDVIPDLGDPIRFRRDLGEREEVTVKGDDWKVLSVIGPGSSVTQIAEELGTTEFWTARVAARLVENELIVLQSTNAPPEPIEASQPYEGIVEEPPTPTEDYEPHDPSPIHDPTQRAVFETAPAEDESEGARQDRSWWQEPEVEGPFDDDESRTPEVVADGLSEMPPVGARDSQDDDEDVEGDTEAFLEKVFSELGSADPSEDAEPETEEGHGLMSEDPEPETEEGHGLLRRRRMGTLRDFSSDS